MRRLFSFGKRPSSPSQAKTGAGGTGSTTGWPQPQPYPTPGELTQMMPAGEYIFTAMVGQGGMGAVYRGRQLRLGREVAVKILHQEHGTDYAYAERFRREAQMLAQMNHPNIVSVHDFGMVRDYLFYAMEFIEGTDLYHLLMNRQVSSEKAAEIVLALCDALGYAHGKGLVHRDLKPANILIAKDGRIKLADFGLAKQLNRPTTLLTLTNMAMGTPDYAAPEQYDTRAVIDHRADIYALGVVFYQMLTGVLPRGAWQPPSALAGCDARLDAVVVRALLPDRNQRYASAQEFRQALEDGLAPPDSAALAQQTRSAGRILVLEDDVLLRQLIVRNLRGENFEVVETEDGAETVKRYGEALAMNRPFDVVLIDLTIPMGMGGARAMENLRLMDPDVKAVVSSGNRTDPAMQDPGEYGFLGVLPKPYGSAELLGIIRRTLQARQG